MSEHTKGPWWIEYESYEDTELPYIEIKPTDCTICPNERASPVLTGQHIADANLIAAAPELLEALKRFIDNNDMLAWTAAVSNARKVIAKAEGRES